MQQHLGLCQNIIQLRIENRRVLFLIPRCGFCYFQLQNQSQWWALHDIKSKNKKACLKDITKFGIWAVTARRDSILQKRISFSLLFVGWAKYSCGEDSLLLNDCYKLGLNIYLSSITIGEVIHRESTWYKGITEKFIFDKGALF